MGAVRVLTDSTADIPAAVATSLNITVVPAYIQINGQSLRDGEQISRAEFYRHLSEPGAMPTTAVPPAHDFTAAFRALAEQADEVIAILVSATLSGMLNAAHLGSDEVPELVTHLVDSQQLSMGLGLQAIVAAEAAAAGATAQQVLERIKQVQPRIRVLAMLDTLENLRRSGRVAWARAVAARILRIKPIIEFRRGEAIMVGQARTRRRGSELLLNMTAALGRLERLVVLHTGSPDVEEFRTRLASVFDGQILTSEVGPIVGTHIGPRALGIAAIIAA